MEFYSFISCISIVKENCSSVCPSVRLPVGRSMQAEFQCLLMERSAKLLFGDILLEGGGGYFFKFVCC